MGRLGQLLLQDGQGHLVGRHEVVDRNHLPGKPASGQVSRLGPHPSICLAVTHRFHGGVGVPMLPRSLLCRGGLHGVAFVRPGPGVADHRVSGAALRGQTGAAAAAAPPCPPPPARRALAGTVCPLAVQLGQDPVERLLDDDGDDVEERVDAANAHEDEKAVAQAIGLLGLVALPLAAHQVTEADGAEGYEAEVERVEVAPVLHGGVEGRGAAGDQQGRHAQDQHHVVDGRLPALQAVVLTPPLPPVPSPLLSL